MHEINLNDAYMQIWYEKNRKLKLEKWYDAYANFKYEINIIFDQI